MKDHDAWEPEWMESRFCAILVCNSVKCGELAAISGSVFVEEAHEQDYNGSWNQSYVDLYEPRSLFPAPLPFQLFDEIPDVVKDRLVEAAGLIWQNSEASANQIRQAVESLMDCRKVKKTRIQSGKRVRMSLHGRIKEFEKTDKDNAELLLAVKWLGNSGSHPGGLDRDNVLDAFDMIEMVLTNLYNKSATAIRRKAKAINKAKGPTTS